MELLVLQPQINVLTDRRNPVLTQTIKINAYIPDRQLRNKVCIEYLRKTIQPGINWSREQAKKFEESKKAINYKIAGIALFDQKFNLF